MRFPIWLTLTAAAIAVGIVLILGRILIKPDRPLIASAGFNINTISPNADGVDDVTQFSYEVTKNAFVSMAFVNDDGDEYVFRDHENRAADEYSVLFSGVVDGYVLPDEDIAGEVLRRLIPDGEYTWTLTATAQDNSETAEKSGTLVVENGDSPLPLMTIFSIGPDEFTPNQDGVNDRVFVNVELVKETDELTVYLVDEDENRIYVPRREEGREPGEAGRHVFDYDGGIDIGADPPPDGEYTVIAEAKDAEGQVVKRTASLTIREGGRPLAEIVSQATGVDVVFDTASWDERFRSSLEGVGDLAASPDDPQSLSQTAITMPVGDLLVFKLTVFNYGAAPIRTTGPPPGTVYEQDQVAASLGEYEQSGVWRIGIQCETSTESYPWRWAIGTDENLYTETDPTNNNVYYYLAPGASSVVWGAIRMTNLVETQNPQDCWAGLIHEDVEVSLQNSNVGRREIELADTSPPRDN
jgi:hypothetical protein